MATTGRYNKVQLGSTYLTRDGTSSGIPCKTEVSGLDALTLSLTGQVIVAIDGTPYMQTLHSQKGVPIGVTVSVMEQSVFNSIKSAINAAIGASTTLTLTLTEGTYGDFKLTVYPALPNAVQFKGEFHLTKVKDVTFNFVVSTVSYPFSAEAGTLTLAGQSATFS